MEFSTSTIVYRLFTLEPQHIIELPLHIAIFMSEDNMLSEAAHNGLQKMRTNGLSPLGRAREKQRIALEWIYFWGFSTETILNIITNSHRRGLGEALKARGLVHKIPLFTKQNLLSNESRSAYSLTEDGLYLAQEYLSRAIFLEYNTSEPMRMIRQQQVQHELLLQKVIASLYSDDSLLRFYSTREMEKRQNELYKVPDAVIVHKTPLGIEETAIEIELSAKYRRDLDEFRSGHIFSIENCEATWSRVAIVSPNEHLLSHYKSSVKPDTPVQMWHKNSSSKRYEPTKEFQISRERSKYFSFYTPEFFIDFIKESPHMSEYRYSYLFADEQDRLEEEQALREAGLLL